MKQTLFLLGPPDREAHYAASEHWVEGGGLIMTANLSGVLPILDYVMSDRIMGARSHTVLVGVHDIQLSSSSKVNLFNLVGDADASGAMLHKIQGISNKIRPQRLFNPPNAVYATSRGRLPTTLANIPGCIVPRTRTAHPKTFSELQAVCESFDSWPVIVRARGYHGGKHMLLLTDESELESLKDLSWPYGGIVLIQFVDCRDKDGLYHKIRVMMVDGVAYARQCVYSGQWAIHAGSRADLMDNDIELCHREERLLAQLRDNNLMGYAPVFKEIHQRIGLDVFGIDFALVNGEVVVFEANACMHFLGRGTVRSPRYAYIDPYKKELRRAIKKMLVKA